MIDHQSGFLLGKARKNQVSLLYFPNTPDPLSCQRSAHGHLGQIRSICTGVTATPQVTIELAQLSVSSSVNKSAKHLLPAMSKEESTDINTTQKTASEEAASYSNH